MISVNLQHLRRLNGYSQEEVAEKIGVSRQAVAKWENGETAPDLTNSMALAELYGVTLDDLVKFDPKQEGFPVPPKGKHVFGTVTVGDRGQIVIPKKARDLFHILPGDSLMVLGDEEQGIALAKTEDFMKLAEELMQMAQEGRERTGKRRK